MIKIDKRKSAATTLGKIYAKWPNPTEYYGDHYRLYTNREHIQDILGEEGLGLPDEELDNVTAVFVGSTERGEFEGVYVTYGTFVTEKATSYYPIVNVAKQGLVSVPFSYQGEFTQLCENARKYSYLTPERLKFLLRGYRLVLRDLGGQEKSVTDTKAAFLYRDLIYVTFGEPTSGTFWYFLDPFTY